MNRNDALTEHYEALRQRALDRQAEGMMWGLVVLRTRGMASWARTWQEYAGGGVSLRPLKESAPSASPLSSTGDEMVRVLAGMVWALRKEAGA